MAQIQDGSGTSYVARVDQSNRLKTFAVGMTTGQDATDREDSFNVNSGLVTITDVSEQGILYLKNNEVRSIRILGIVTILGPSTGGSTTDTTRIRIYKNATTGTLISEANVADTVSNRNFGSSLALTADVYKGDGSSTVTNGTVHIESLVNPGSRVFFGIDEVLTKGDTIAITYEPNDGNTNMKAMAAIICHLNDPNK